MDLKQLKDNMFFRGMDENEIRDAFESMNGTIRSFKKGSIVLSAGEPTDTMGLVLSGSVTIENNDLWGNRTLLSHIGRNGIFAETYAMLGNEPVSVDVTVNEDAVIAFFRLRTVMERTSFRTSWENKIIRNLLAISAQKNLVLSGRSFHISPKSVRGRVMSYLNMVSLRKHAKEFDIPFDRQQMADYLNVDRTALSKELGRMQSEGILSFKKNHFKIIIPDLQI